MRIHPNWPVAVGVYVVYNLIIFATWRAVGAQYADLVSEHAALHSLVLPLSLGAVFAGGTVTYLGWWRPALWETAKASRKWLLLPVLAVMGGFIAVHATSIHWSALSQPHLTMLIAAGLMVGFNEELVTRGVLVTGVRGATSNEVWVWFWSSVLFGAMHIPNAFFGIPLFASLIQGVFAFLMGGAFYLVRRLSGTILLPMALHAGWDFVSFSSQASHSAVPLSPLFQFGTYFVAIVSVIVLLSGRHDRARAT